MTVEFDSRCGTAQSEDFLKIFIPSTPDSSITPAIGAGTDSTTKKNFSGSNSAGKRKIANVSSTNNDANALNTI